MSHRTPENIILAPVVTEEAMRLSAERNTYLFRVPRWANKVEIRHAIQTLFKVEVASVRTTVLPGKWKRQGLRQGRIPGWKKAYVTLLEGSRIEMETP